MKSYHVFCLSTVTGDFFLKGLIVVVDGYLGGQSRDDEQRLKCLTFVGGQVPETLSNLSN